MPNINSMDKSSQEYFYSLPVMLQEQIMQSNANFTCKEDIERYYKSVLSSAQNKISK